MTTGRYSYKLVGATGIHKGDRNYQQDQVCLLAHKISVMAVLADGMGGVAVYAWHPTNS